MLNITCYSHKIINTVFNSTFIMLNETQAIVQLLFNICMFISVTYHYKTPAGILLTSRTFHFALHFTKIVLCVSGSI